MKINNKQKNFIILLILINIFLVFYNIDVSLARDESLAKIDFEKDQSIKRFIGDSSQPIFFQMPHSIMATIFGSKNFAYRLIPAISSIILSIILFFRLKKENDVNIAIFGLLLLITLPWYLHMATSTLSTSLLTLTIFISLILFEKYVNTKKEKYLWYSSIVTAIAINTMYLAAILAISVIFFLLLTKKIENKRKIKIAIKYALGIAAITVIVNLPAVILNPNNLISSYNHAYQLAVNNENSQFPVIGLNSIFILLLWSGPIILLLLNSLFKIRIKELRENIHLIYVLIAFLIIFLLNADKYRPFDRYFMIIIPSMILIIFKYEKESLEKLITGIKKHSIAISTIILSFLIIASLPIYKIVPLEPKIDFIKGFFINAGTYLVPYSSNSGPHGFYAPGLIILFAWLSIIFLIILNLIIKNRKIINTVLIILLVSNMIIASYQTGIVGKTNPNYAVDELLQELPKIELSQNTLYYLNSGISAYFPKNIKGESFDLQNYKEYLEKYENYTLIIIDFPKIPDEHEIWNITRKCKNEYESKNYNVYKAIYTCKMTSDEDRKLYKKSQ